jgi:hypothetical protein
MFFLSPLFLTIYSIPVATNSITASNTGQRAMALPASQDQFHVDWHPGLASQTPSAARRI